MAVVSILVLLLIQRCGFLFLVQSLSIVFTVTVVLTIVLVHESCCKLVSVIDFCLTKTVLCDPVTNYPSLQLQWASKGNCQQRKGTTFCLTRYHCNDYLHLPVQFIGLLPEWVNRWSLYVLMVMFMQWKLEAASTHKNANTHTDDISVPWLFDPKIKLVSRTHQHFPCQVRWS